MSYEIERRSNCVMVKLLGNVRAADILNSQEEDEFVLGVEDTVTAIYDYSDAVSVSISQREAEALAVLVDHLARFQKSISIIIVPRDPADTQLADAYCASITSDKVNARVVATTSAALQLAETLDQG